MNSKGHIRFDAYNARVAERIIKLNPERMRAYFAAEGLSEDKTTAFIGRLTAMQSALQSNKTSSKHRNYLEAEDKFENASNPDELTEAVTKLNELCYQEARDIQKFSYLQKDLIMDNGNTEEGEMKQVNRDVDNDLVTEKRVADHKAKLLADIERDKKEKYGGQELSEETKRILELIDLYVANSMRGQKAVRLYRDNRLLSLYLTVYGSNKYKELEKKAKAQHPQGALS